MKKIIILVLLMLVLLNACGVGDNYKLTCQEICKSNELSYYGNFDSGYVGTVHTCYCKNNEGGISTYVM